MMVHEDIIAEHIAEPVTKIIGEPMRSNIDLLEEELVNAKVKTTKDIIKQGKKNGFLIIELIYLQVDKIIFEGEIMIKFYLF